MRLIYLISIVIYSFGAYSSEVCSSLSVTDFYLKIKSSGPLKAEIDKRKLIPEASIDIAKQRPNPQLDFDYLKGDEFGIDKNTYTLSAAHTIELGGKRSKRISKANIDSEIEMKKLNLGLYRNYVEQVKKFQRVGQLKILTETIEEAIATFRKLIKKLQSRKGLNPEERISLSTLKLALNEYKSQLNDYKNEYDLEKGEVEFYSQCTSVELKHQSLDFKGLEEKDFSGSAGAIELAGLEVKSAEANLELEKSLGYSNLSVGPQVEYLQTGEDEVYSAGIVVSFDLPLFHRNTGGKLKASRELGYQRVSSQNNLKFLGIRKNKLISKYRRSLDTLSKMPTLPEVEKKHQEIEKLFARGIVSMALTIEAHRQNLDFITSRFDTEMDLLNVIEEMILLTGDEKMIEKILLSKRSQE